MGNKMHAWSSWIITWMSSYCSELFWISREKRVNHILANMEKISPECEWRIRSMCVRKAMRHAKDSRIFQLCYELAEICDSMSKPLPSREGNCALERLAFIRRSLCLEDVDLLVEADHAPTFYASATAFSAAQPVEKHHATARAFERAAKAVGSLEGISKSILERSADGIAESILAEMERDLDNG